MQIQSSNFSSPRAPMQTKCTPPILGDGHVSHDHVHISATQREPLGPSKVGVSDQLRKEVVTLTQGLVQINSGPDNLVAGENQTVDLMSAYAQKAGLEVNRFESTNGKPMLIVTLPGKDPQAGAMGFVHHSDVVQPEGEWKLGQPFSGNITNDEAGRESLVGRGSIDTKGPAAQVLVAMKHLKEKGEVPDRAVKLFIFPDEEFGGKDGAWLLSRKKPELFADVKYWVVEGSGVFSPEFLSGLAGDRDCPYLAVAQKYTIPMQLQLKNPTSADEAFHKTQATLDKLDHFIEKRDWTYLGDKSETKKAMKRMGDAVGGFKGFMIRNFYKTGFMQKRMGKGNAAANRTDFCKTDFYFSNNPGGVGQGPNVKPSSASVVLKLDASGEQRARAVQSFQKAAGEEIRVLDQNGQITVSLPQENYHGGNHGSTTDRDRDAVDVVNRALTRVEKEAHKQGLDEKLEIVNYFTSKSKPNGAIPEGPVTSNVTLDLRVAVDENPKDIIAQLNGVIGSDFQLKPLMGPEELDAKVRRLHSSSPLFQAAEQSIQHVYGESTPVLFGNTTASNDTRFLMDINPQSEALTFVPVLYTNHGAHGPDEAVTVKSLQQGVDWVVDLIQRVK
ncbi:MAG: M20/M25/M40 family metallo-hydrolase [Candidatus Eremiobacteraeota bacterium]|nr:M20/M25/M40 family metallo-hydrolase [Candidatus Eremiobacteraeota bacterium]